MNGDAPNFGWKISVIITTGIVFAGSALYSNIVFAGSALEQQHHFGWEHRWTAAATLPAVERYRCRPTAQPGLVR